MCCADGMWVQCPWHGAAAQGADVVQQLATADVVILGEVHDNPAHHQMQADAYALVEGQSSIQRLGNKF